MAYLVLLGLGALDAAGYGIIAPVVPAIADETETGPALMGALVAAFAVGMSAGFFAGGRILELRHASFVIAVGIVATGAGSVGFIVGDGFTEYIVARLVMGFGSGALWIGVTFAVIERFPGREYGRLTGLLAAYSVGGIAGPALGAAGGIRAPFAAYLGLAALAGIALVAIGAPAERPSFSSDRAALRHPGFWLASAGVLLVAIAYGTVDGPLPLHFDDRLSQGGIGALYVGASLVLGASAAVAGRLEPRPLLAAGTVLMVVGLGLAGASDALALWIVALALAAVGFGIGEAGALGIFLEAIGTERIVLAMVVWSQLWAVGYLVGPAAGGAVAEALGFGAIGLVPLVGSVLVAAAFARAPRAVPEVRSAS